MAPKEIAVVAECLMCMSHMAVPVAVLVPDHFKQRPGWNRKPAVMQEEWLEALQEKMAEGGGGVSLVCPYCVQLEEAIDWEEYVSGEAVAEFNVMRLVEFERGEGPPLYMNDSTHAGAKKKWVLCQGVGPQVLDLDRSRSGKIYKKCYNAAGLCGDMLRSVEIDAANPKLSISLPSQGCIQRLVNSLYQCYWLSGPSKTKAFIAAVATFKPLLTNNEIQAELDAIVADRYTALDTFLETYCPKEEEEEEEEEVQEVAPKHSKKKHYQKPPPAMRELRTRGEKREAARRQVGEMVDEYNATCR